MDNIVLFSMPDSVGEWVFFVGIIVLILGFAGVAVYTTIKLLKNGGKEKIKDAVVDAVKQAEATHKTGAEKKEIAMEALRSYCNSIGLKFTDKIISLASLWIDKYIEDHNELEEIEDKKDN